MPIALALLLWNLVIPVESLTAPDEGATVVFSVATYMADLF